MTRSKTKWIICMAILIIFAQCKQRTRYPAELDKLVPEASLIFKGKILLLHTNNTDEADVSNSAVAEVVSVMQSPESIGDITGQQITVRLNDINSVKEGDERIFFTKPYIQGDNLGVTEIGNMVIKDEKAIRDLPGQIKSAQDHAFAEKVNQHIAKADLVILGKIGKIEPARAENEGKLSEHNPEYSILEINVSENIKGSADKTVRILYPTSNDVAYRNFPKVKTGEDWMFILNPSDSKKIPYKIQSHELIVPMERYNQIKDFIKK